MSIQRVCFFWNEQLSCCHFHFLDVHRFIYLFGNISIQAGLGGRALVLLLEKFLSMRGIDSPVPSSSSEDTVELIALNTNRTVEIFRRETDRELRRIRCRLNCLAFLLVLCIAFTGTIFFLILKKLS